MTTTTLNKRTQIIRVSRYDTGGDQEHEGEAVIALVWREDGACFIECNEHPGTLFGGIDTRGLRDEDLAQRLFRAHVQHHMDEIAFF